MTPLDFFRILVREMPRRVALVVTLHLAAGVAEGFGLLLLIPLLALVGLSVPQGLPAGVQGAVEGGLAALGARPTLPLVLLVFLAVMALRAGLRRWSNVASAALEARYTLRWQQRLYEAVFGCRWPVLVRERIPELTHALTVDVDRITLANMYTTRLLAFAAVSGVYLAFALALAPWLTLLACGMGGVVLAVGRRWNLRVRKAGEDLTRAGQDLSAAVQDYLGALKTARSHGAEDRTVERFRARSREVVRVVLDAEGMHASASGWMSFLAALLLAVLVLVSVDVLALPTATLLLLVVVFARVIPRILALQTSYHYLLNALPGFENVVGLTERLEGEAEVWAPALAPAVPGTVALDPDFETDHPDPDPPPLQEGILLQDVGFSYHASAAIPVLSQLTLSIPAGKMTAVVGPSGAGKTTVADLVLGLLAPQEGEVQVDGRLLDPLRMPEWRRRVGYVPQDGALLPDTIRTNLRWANPAAGEAEMWEALELAAARSFVEALPQGLDTVVGERGALVSGGERQRLALASALVRRPALLVLDEATSALDGENEGRVLEALRGLGCAVTVLLISHRLSAVRDAHLIHVLEGGRVLESGSWEELVEADGRFAAMARVQGVWSRVSSPGTSSRRV